MNAGVPRMGSSRAIPVLTEIDHCKETHSVESCEWPERERNCIGIMLQRQSALGGQSPGAPYFTPLLSR